VPLKKGGSAERVRDFLTERGLAEGLIHFECSTKTAQMAADAAGCELGQIVKSLVFVADGRPVLALVAGDRRGDTAAIAQLAGADSAAFADAETVREATGYAIGGVSPFDLPDGLLVLVDDSLDRFEWVFPAAGTPSSMVRMRREDLLAITKGRVARISHGTER
jgi:prolyl-tRNA editing enzyme YbaK/EbsC (Cys-tRNA(Pro) deacylase)